MAKSAISVTGPLIKLVTFAVVTALFTGVLGISIANLNLSSTNTYKARFSDVTMLLQNDDVRIAGVRVGQVTDVKVVDKDVAEVTFEVSSGRKLPKGTIAAVKWRNLVGQRYVELEPPPDAPVNGGDTLPTDGTGTIPQTDTRPAVDLTELFNGFKPLFVALTPKDINNLSYEIIQVLQGEGGTVESLLAHTADLTNSIADKDKVIGQVIDNLNALLDTLNKKTPQLNDTIDTLDKLVKGLTKDVDPIADSFVSIDKLARTTAGFLKDVRPDVRKSIHDLGPAARTLNNNSPYIERFLKNSPGDLYKLGRTVSYGSWMNFFWCRGNINVNLDGSPLPLSGGGLSLPKPNSNAARCQ